MSAQKETHDLEGRIQSSWLPDIVHHKLQQYYNISELHQPPEIPSRRPITGLGGSARQLSTPSSSSGGRPIPPPDTFHHSSKPHFFTPVSPSR